MKPFSYLAAVSLALLIVALLLLSPADAQNTSPQGASSLTEQINSEVYGALPFEEDQLDYANARNGFISAPEPLTICKDYEVPDCSGGTCSCTGTVVWDMKEYQGFIDIDPPTQDDNETVAPATVNPSLWRNAQLNMRYGLFRVVGKNGATDQPNADNETDNLALLRSDTEGIYQVRGYDLSNITFIKSNNGWIVFDPLISPETAKAALDLINGQLGEPNRRVVAVVYSHSHIDHYGGAPGLFHPNGQQGDEEIFGPEGFTEHAVSENVIAGNAMGRRAIYMYGSLLPRNAQGSVNAGLGQTSSTGEAGLIEPTIFISEDGERPVDAEGDDLELTGSIVSYSAGVYTVDGVEMQFQMTPGTEAPAEMNTYFPQLNALWMAENATNTMHNVLTLRGAQVRDAYKWVSFLNETIETWGDDAQVKFQSHHWPLWAEGDTGNIVEYLKKQRDIYKFTHDQTVRMMNNGYTGEEISDRIKLPESLETNWATRGYYGTLRHNSRAVYQFYMGWYDGHPSDLNNLPPEKVAEWYMRYMSDGSGESVYTRAKRDFDNAENPETYRWVAEVMKHAVFAAGPSDEEVTPEEALLADALEQLGYQAESGPWRSVYLQGAHELRNGVLGAGGTATATPDTIKAMPPEMVFDYWAVHLCPDAVAVAGNECTVRAEAGDTAGGPLVLDVTITDAPGATRYALTVENAVLNYSTVIPTVGIDAELTMTMDQLHNLLLSTEDQIEEAGDITVVSGQAEFDRFKGMLDLEDNFWFNIITP